MDKEACQHQINVGKNARGNLKNTLFQTKKESVSLLQRDVAYIHEIK